MGSVVLGMLQWYLIQGRNQNSINKEYDQEMKYNNNKGSGTVNFALIKILCTTVM